jgi:predicted transposase YbfD/YdcC
MPKRKSVAEIEDEENTASVLEYLATVPDPRKERTRLHSLKDILVLSLCAIICGADGFVAIEEFGIRKKEWLKTFLDLPNGIPSHDTIGRVFALLSPKALEAVFRAWMRAVAVLTKGEVVAIDGKTLRRSFREAGSGLFVHMVSAWATRNRVVLGQVKTEEKSNEITAIPELLGLLYLKGCIVTIDAMGCQKDIAAKIIAEGADYCLTVKDNQPTLREDLAATFEAARTDPAVLATMDFTETRDKKAHGRIEVRRCWTTTALDGVSQADQWKGLRSLALIEVDRTVGGKTSTEQRYVISSCAGLSATKALKTVRAHWGIENELHWVLDVAFREDDCRVRAGNAAENFAVLRHVALNLLKKVQGTKVGIKIRRQCAAWDNEFLLRVLGAAC